MRGIKFIVTLMAVLMVTSFAAMAAQVETIDTEHIIVEHVLVEAGPVADTTTMTETSKPWYEAAWDGVCGAASTCGGVIVDGACAVGNGAKYVAGSYLLWYADVNGKITAWAQETGTELVG